MEVGVTIVKLHLRSGQPEGLEVVQPAIVTSVLNIPELASEGHLAVNVVTFDSKHAYALGGPDWHHAFRRVLPVRHQSHPDVQAGKLSEFYTQYEDDGAKAEINKLADFLLLNYGDQIKNESAVDLALRLLSETAPCPLLCTDDDFGPIEEDDVIYYGPYPCVNCGEQICRSQSDVEPVLTFDYPAGPIYPNTEWPVHACKGVTSEVGNTNRNEVSTCQPRSDTLDEVTNER